MRVFILESNEIIIATFWKVFTEFGRGHQITIAHNCGEALRMFNGPYDIILMNNYLGKDAQASGTDYAMLMPTYVGSYPAPIVFVYTKTMDDGRAMVSIIHGKHYRCTWFPFGVGLVNHLEQQSKYRSDPPFEEVQLP